MNPDQPPRPPMTLGNIHILGICASENVFRRETMSFIFSLKSASLVAVTHPVFL